MRNSTRFAATLLVATLALVGCSRESSDPSPAPASPAATPTTEPTVEPTTDVVPSPTDEAAEASGDAEHLAEAWARLPVDDDVAVRKPAKPATVSDLWTTLALSDWPEDSQLEIKYMDNGGGHPDSSILFSSQVSSWVHKAMYTAYLADTGEVLWADNMDVTVSNGSENTFVGQVVGADIERAVERKDLDYPIDIQFGFAFQGHDGEVWEIMSETLHVTKP